MKTCPNCSANLDDAAAFCAQCGAQVPPAADTPPANQPLCTGCGAPVEKDYAFCQNCGTPVDAAAEATPAASENQPVQPVYQQPGATSQPGAAAQTATAVLTRPSEKQKKLSPKILIIAAAAVVVIAAALVAFFVFRPSEKSNLLYLKDGQLSVTSLGKIAPFELTDGLYENDDNMYAGYYTFISDDGKYMYYPDNMNSDDETADLYMINLTANNAKSSTAVKVDSGISDFSTSLDGTKVFYLKDDKLYFFNLKDKVKVDSGVDNFYISDDGLKLIYETGDDTLYYKDYKTNGDTEKIDSNVEVQYISSDIGKVYYLKNDALYVKEVGKDKVKIDSDVDDAPAIYDSGVVYYVKSTTENKMLSDFVTDDMASYDAVIEEPEFEDFVTYDEYGYWDVDYDAYYDAYDAYYYKLDRDNLRDELRATSYDVIKASLYYYDGQESQKVTDSYDSFYGMGPEKAMVVYTKHQTTDLPKMKLSELSSSYDVEDALETALYSEYDLYIAVGTKETEIEQESADYFEFNKAGTMVYFMDNYSYEDYAGELYSMTISGDSVGSPELYAEDIYYYYYILNDSDGPLYFRDLDGDTYCGDLYIGKNKIDSDVYCYGVHTFSDNQNFVYRTDVDDDYIGTLKKYDGKNTAKISDDVYDFVTNEKGTIAYISNYDTDDEAGDAYLYTGGKEPKFIDKDVSYLLLLN